MFPRRRSDRQWFPLGRRAAWRIVGWAGVLAAAALVAGCSAVTVLNSVSVTPSVKVTRDLAYGAKPRQKLDVYAPPGVAGARPVVVFFYGGSWDSGSKGDYAFVGQALARRGYVAVVADYRVYPNVVWPSFLQDSAAAVRWTHDHAATYGGDPRRLLVMGHSAGAYNAIELAVDKRWLTAERLDPARDLAAAIGLSGPYDFLPLRSAELKSIFGAEAKRPDTQPINHVDGLGPPLLLVTGDRDTTVDPGNSERLAAKVRAAGGEVQVIHYPSLDHVRTVAALAPSLQWLAPVMRDVVGFIDAQTAPQSAASPPR